MSRNRQLLVDVCIAAALLALATWTRREGLLFLGGATGRPYLQWADLHYYGGISRTYLSLADQLRAGATITSTIYPPGYPAWLAALSSLGCSPTEMRAVQAGADVVATVAVFAIARAVGISSAWAAIAGAAYAVHPVIALGSTLLTAEALSPLLVLATSGAIIAAMASTARFRWFAVGVVVGIASMVRPDLLLFGAVAGIAALAATPTRRSALVALASLGLGVFVVFAPWGLHNRVVNHKWIFTTTGRGAGLWEGLGELPNNYGYILSDAETAKVLWAHGLRFGTLEGDAYLAQDYWRGLREHPAFVARVALHRWRRIAFETERLPTGAFSHVRDIAERWSLLVWFAALWLCRRSPAQLLIVAAPLVVACLGIGLIHYEARYVRFVLLSFIFAGAVVGDVASRWLFERYPVFTSLAGVALLAIGVRHVAYQLYQLHLDRLQIHWV